MNNMNVSLMVMLVLIFSAIAIVVFKVLARISITAGRKEEAIENIHAAVAGEVGLSSFRDLVLAMGDCYRINPELIRPHDLLEDIFAYDSWALDGGTEKLNDWLISNGLGVDDLPVKTVLELAQAVERSRLGRIL